MVGAANAASDLTTCHAGVATREGGLPTSYCLLRAKAAQTPSSDLTTALLLTASCGRRPHPRRNTLSPQTNIHFLVRNKLSLTRNILSATRNILLPAENM